MHLKLLLQMARDSLFHMQMYHRVKSQPSRTWGTKPKGSMFPWINSSRTSPTKQLEENNYWILLQTNLLLWIICESGGKSWKILSLPRTLPLKCMEDKIRRTPDQTAPYSAQLALPLNKNVDFSFQNILFYFKEIIGREWISEQRLSNYWFALCIPTIFMSGQS